MIRKIITYCYKFLFARNSMQIFNKLKKMDIIIFEKNRKQQINKLQGVLEVAFSNIPYYRTFGNLFNIDDFSYEDFQKLPVLSKDIIRNQGMNLVNNGFQPMNNVFKNTSGGSTGEPVSFFRTKSQSHHGSANYYYAMFLNGANIYDRSVDLWGAERDMYNASTKFDLGAVIHNKTTLNTFVLNDKIIENYIKRLNTIRPKFIKAYVHSLYDISKYINKHRLSIKFTPIIHCTTGPLYPEVRKEIEKAFNGAHVYSFYGSREVSAIGSEIKGKDGMYILFDNVFVEILDKHNRPVEEGEEGEVVVTTLNNFYMPLIRYKIGDRAIKGDSFSFGTLKLDNVTGRTLGVIYKKDGTKIDGQFFTTLFFNKPSIKGFQLVQKTLDNLVLNVVKSDYYKPEELKQIIQRIKTELPNIDIEVVFCESINLTQTGKIMYVYSELDI